MSKHYTPLRYPGGKGKLAPYIKAVFRENRLCDGHYVEPYAGGAGVALDLLLTEHASEIHLNDLNHPLYAFWHTLLNEPEELCRRIKTCKVSVHTWRRQRNIIREANKHSMFEVGFAFFFLNRTNRSGIINGGVIGGLDQKGNWKIDARFNRNTLIARVERILEYKERIHIYNMDAGDFLLKVPQTLPQKSLIYLDPPYYIKGQRLYDNHYKHDDHQEIAELVQSKVNRPWLVSYDNAPEIVDLYTNRKIDTFNLHYSAAGASTGSELMIYGKGLKIPTVESCIFRKVA